MGYQGFGLAVALVLLAGCAATTPSGWNQSEIVPAVPDAGSSAPSQGDVAPGPSSTATPSARTPAPTPAPTTKPRTTAAAAASPARAPVDPALEQMLPTSFEGIPLHRFSTPASVFSPGGDVCMPICPGEPYRFAEELGVPVESMTIAVAVTDDLGLVAVAYRVPGVTGERLVAARHAILGEPGSRIPLTEQTIGGREVTFMYLGLLRDVGEYLVAGSSVLVVLYGEPPASDGAVPDYIRSELAEMG